MQAAFKASKQIYSEAADEESCIREDLSSGLVRVPRRTEAYRWFRVGEGTMDNFMFSALSAPPAAKGAPVKKAAPQAAPAKG